MWTAAEVVTPPTAPAIARGDAKEFLRITADTTDFDTQLDAFVAVAIEHIEAVCGIRFAPQVLELRADDWSDLARLPIGPVSQIETIHYVDAAGSEQLIDDAAYELSGAGLATSIELSVGSNWPTNVRAIAGAIRVRLTAGYAELPRPLWAAALYLVGDLFAFRETAVVGTVSAKIQMSATVEAMLTNYRIWL